MAAPQYNPQGSYTFQYRLEMCQAVEEGCELGDAVRALCAAARILRAWDDFHSELVLLATENICRQYVKDHLWKLQSDWDDYNACDPNVFAHFTGGAQKLTEEEFNHHQKIRR